MIRLVIKDLIKYDGLKTELIIINKIISEKDSVIKVDSIIDSKKDKIILNLDKSLQDSKQQFKLQEEISKAYLKEYRKQQLYTYISGASGILVGILIKTLFIK